MENEQIRRHIQQLKELPTLAPDLRRIIEACEDPEIGFQELAKALYNSPTISARLLGLSNSAFFGQSGRVLTLEHAIAVLGLPMVRAVATGLALSGAFRVGRCPRFKLQRYWLTSILTAAMAEALSGQVGPRLGLNRESAYLGGLLHNFGLLALVHLFPDELELAFAAYAEAPEQRLAGHLQRILEIDHYQAGAWLGGKWHLPRELLLVMAHHHDPAYREAQWPLVLLTGFCARWAADCLNGIERDGVITGLDTGAEDVIRSLRALEIDQPAAEAAQRQVLPRLPELREMAATLAG